MCLLMVHNGHNGGFGQLCVFSMLQPVVPLGVQVECICDQDASFASGVVCCMHLPLSCAELGTTVCGRSGVLSLCAACATSQ